MKGFSSNIRQTSSGSMELPTPKLTTPFEQMQGGEGKGNLMSLMQPLTGGQIQRQRMTFKGGSLMNFLKSIAANDKMQFSEDITSGNFWKF